MENLYSSRIMHSNSFLPLFSNQQPEAKIPLINKTAWASRHLPGRLRVCGVWPYTEVVREVELCFPYSRGAGDISLTGRAVLVTP